jgi:hypothetical protein
MSLRDKFSLLTATGMLVSGATHGWMCWVALAVAFVGLMGVMHPQTMQRWVDRLRGRETPAATGEESSNGEPTGRLAHPGQAG